MNDISIIDYKAYLKSDYWKDIREKVHERDGYRCRICNLPNDICVHHRTYKFVGNENMGELITLCKSCHNRYHKINTHVSYSNHIRDIAFEKKKEMLYSEKEEINNYIFLISNSFNLLKDRLIKIII